MTICRMPAAAGLTLGLFMAICYGTLSVAEDVEKPMPVASPSGENEPDVALAEQDAAAERAFGPGPTLDLLRAIRRGDEADARRLITAGADINSPGQIGARILHGLAAFQDPPAIRLAIKLGANPDVVMAGGQTPLCQALRHAREDARWFEAFETLVDAGADLEFASRQRFPHLGKDIEMALFWEIVSYGRQESLGGRYDWDKLFWLIEKGGNVNAQGSTGETLAFMAYLKREYDLARKLLEAGGNPHVKTRPGKNFYTYPPILPAPIVPVSIEEQQAARAQLLAKLEELKNDEKLKAEAEEIDRRFRKKLAAYHRSPRHLAELRMRGEIGQITEILRQQVEEEGEIDAEKKEPEQKKAEQKNPETADAPD